MTRLNGEYGMLITTVSSRDDAIKIVEALLAAKLAACVQILPIQSYYTWKGETANEDELLLLIKTRTALFEEIIAEVKKIHPYETPEIVATDFIAGLSDYFEWISEVTK